MKKQIDATSDLPKLAAPAQRALAGAGYSQLKQLAKVKESELKALHGMGPNALKVLKDAMRAQGLVFAPEGEGHMYVTPANDFPKIGMPATTALTYVGYTKLKQLTTLTEKEILKIHGVGPKAVRILKEEFKARGWSFKAEKKKAS